MLSFSNQYQIDFEQYLVIAKLDINRDNPQVIYTWILTMLPLGINPRAGGAMKPYWQTGGARGLGRLA